MVTKIAEAIVGYITMAAFVFISFTVLYLILGAEGSFEPGDISGIHSMGSAKELSKNNHIKF